VNFGGVATICQAKNIIETSYKEIVLRIKNAVFLFFQIIGAVFNTCVVLYVILRSVALGEISRCDDKVWRSEGR